MQPAVGLEPSAAATSRKAAWFSAFAMNPASYSTRSGKHPAGSNPRARNLFSLEDILPLHQGTIIAPANQEASWAEQKPSGWYRTQPEK